MGRLLDGKWITQDLGPDAQGRFVRRATQFRSSSVEPTPGRYLLILSAACGWSHRTLLVRALQGLQEVISVIYADAYMGEDGWTFGEGISGETLFREPTEEQRAVCIKAMHQLYVLANPNYTGRASVPVLWDRDKGTIVNNESSDIVKLLLNEFSPLAKTPRDLVSSDRETAIQEMIRQNYGPINNGVYRCGFAASQTAYDEAAQALFQRLEELEVLLGQQRYLMGDSLTLADICLFPTLYRFDHVYYTHFKCSKKHLYEYPNLWGWTRELYQCPGVADTCDLENIREHYFTSHESIHPRRYIPIMADIDFDAPHGRDVIQLG